MKVRLLFLGLWLGVGALAVSAEITFSLTLHREVKPAYDAGYGPTRYYAYPTLSDTNTPISYHRVESPTDICSANFGTNTDTAVVIFDDAADFFGQLTNGNWKLWLNRDTPEELFYTFTVTPTAPISDTFGPITILSPRDGAINVSSNTPYQWMAPADFDAIEVAVNDQLGELLAGTPTNWNAGPVLAPGTNFFRVTFHKNAAAEFSISTPTNDASGLLTNWVTGPIHFASRAGAGFIVAGLPPSALAQALDAPGLIWETSGATDWFPQSSITRDGRSAARSGVIGDSEFSTLRTLIYGTNTVTFWWKADCEGSADYVAFSDNGIYVDDLTGDTGWKRFTYHLAPGVAHWLEWTYYKDSSDAEGADAVFLDQVRLAGDPGFPEGEPVTFSLTLRRQQTDAFNQLGTNQTWFTAIPSISGPTNPISYHRVEAPDDCCSVNFGPTNSGSISFIMLDFAAFAAALTNGNWKVWLNKETPQEEFHTFTLTAPNFCSNDFGVVTITSPLDGATNISAHPPYEWNGLPTWEELFIEANQDRFGTNYQYAAAFPALDTTSWLAGPNLAAGTNHFSVRYRTNVTSHFTVTKPFMNWSVEAVIFESSANSGFIVPPATPVQLINPHQLDDHFQFAFTSEIGRTNLIQSSTNLSLGLWETRTNIVGDGTLQTLSLPIGPEPAEFFRIVTE
jgi:hypothetical protein